jgi:hypothetical protein
VVPIPHDYLAFFVLDDSAALVIATFWTDRMGRDCNAALRAIADLTLLHVVVRASFAGTAVGVFAFGDSHRWEVRI